MSAIFLSTATNTWKIAFAAPVYLDGQFLGITAVTANILGSFIEFDDTNNQYVMLIDTRAGPYRGTVLEHPLISRLLKAKPNDSLQVNQKLPENLTNVKISDEVLERIVNEDAMLHRFRDPMAEEPQGVVYDRELLASWADVTRRGPNGRMETGFKVIAVADETGALAPSRSLGQQLLNMGSLAVGIFILVSMGLLLFVFQSLRRSREKAVRMGGITNENSLTGPSTGEGITMAGPPHLPTDEI